VLPIHRLLSRIRWDRRFGAAKFALGYFDRIERRVVVVPFDSVRLPPDAPGVFEIVDATGELHRVPMHRVRQVYRDGRLIWERRHPP
jgi:uncharacterized protein (UPF0248 family)